MALPKKADLARIIDKLAHGIILEQTPDLWNAIVSLVDQEQSPEQIKLRLLPIVGKDSLLAHLIEGTAAYLWTCRKNGLKLQ